MAYESTLTPLATADNGALAPEVRAELQVLAQGAKETIQKAWSPHTHRAYAAPCWKSTDRASAKLIHPATVEDSLWIALVQSYGQHCQRTLITRRRPAAPYRTPSSVVPRPVLSPGPSPQPSPHQPRPRCSL